MNARVRHVFLVSGIAVLTLSSGWTLRVLSKNDDPLATKQVGHVLRRVEAQLSRRSVDSAGRPGGAVGANEITPPREAIPEPPRLDEADALRAWARNDPAQATRWLGTAPAGPRRDVVLDVVCLEVAQYNPAEAIAIADRYGYPGMNLRENLVAQWAEENAGAAKGYADAQPPGPERDRLLGRVAFAWAKSRPADAAQLVMTEITPGRTQEDAAASVVNEWLQRDLVGPQQWIQSLPDASLRERLAREWNLAARTVH